MSLIVPAMLEASEVLTEARSVVEWTPKDQTYTDMILNASDVPGQVQFSDLMTMAVVMWMES